MTFRTIIIIASIAIGMATGGYVVFTNHVLPFKVSTTLVSASRQDKGSPSRLVIPSIGVDASVEHLGLTPEGSVKAPDGPYNVSWFDVGPYPGEQGSAVISGHYGPWKNGAQSVFNNLNKLKPGDKVYVEDGRGAMIEFTVRKTKVYEVGDKALEVFDRTDGKYLNLITCNGTWLDGEKTYTNRLVVFTERTN